MSRPPAALWGAGKGTEMAEKVLELGAPENVQEEWLNGLLRKFPVFDPAWPDYIQRRWFASWERLHVQMVAADRLEQQP